MLSSSEIEDMCNKQNLIRPFDKQRIRGTTYDLVFGGEYYLFSKEAKKVEDMINTTEVSVIIPPHEVCYAATENTLDMPNNLCGVYYLKSRFIRLGLVSPAAPPIPPGLKGKIFAMLYNLSDHSVTIDVGEPFLAVTFFRTSLPNPPYTGAYAIKSLKQVIKTPIHSGISNMKERLEDLEGRLDSYTQKLQTNLGLIILTITVIIAILTGYSVFKAIP
jgi:deoxycytidine triphosphate deaminase